MELLIGAVLGVLAAGLFHPLAERLERLSRRLWRVKPLFVTVEQHAELVWAGQPPWVPAVSYFRSLPRGPPPQWPSEWWPWARRLGGRDADLSYLEVTIQARKEVSLVVERAVVRQQVGDAPAGVVAVCPTGGADLSPRRLELDLDWGPGGLVTFYVESETAAQLPALKLAPGEVERFQVWARAAHGYHQWRLDLHLLVDGRRLVQTIDGAGEPFVTVGTEGLEQFAWEDDGWRPFPPPGLYAPGYE